MVDDFERCYRAVHSKDARFDGWFVTAVTSTGIYCRPSCPATTPKRANVRFYASAAAAHGAGFRACKRCRPDASPGSPEWNVRADVVGRAMRLIADGSVDRDGVAGLARRLGFSERHLHRQLIAELGAGPIALARAQRAQTARLLIETTTLPFTDVAFAAGFPSIRQFNETIRDVFATTPTELRRGAAARGVAGPVRSRSGAAAGPTVLAVRLRHRPPLHAAGLLAYLGVRAIPGVERIDAAGTTFERVLDLPHGSGIASLRPAADHVACTLRLTDLRDLAAAVQRCRRLLDLDADPVAVDDALGADPLLAPLVRRAPGRRVPGAADGAELAVRAVIGQQISVTGARTIAGRLAAELGTPLPVALVGEDVDAPGSGAARDGHAGNGSDARDAPRRRAGGAGARERRGCDRDGDPAAAQQPSSLTHVFPSAAALAAAGRAGGDLPMPRARALALTTLCAALAAGDVELDPGADRDATRTSLLALPGIGPWTADYVAMRALGDPDAFPASDLGLRRALARLDQPDDPRAVAALAERWRPWRAYAAHHLWASLADEGVPA
jgi:AraC family transcriptional regulator of adaptative response / DNA-3-methyladenine glycosylase II